MSVEVLRGRETKPCPSEDVYDGVLMSRGPNARLALKWQLLSIVMQQQDTRYLDTTWILVWLTHHSVERRTLRLKRMPELMLVAFKRLAVDGAKGLSLLDTAGPKGPKMSDYCVYLCPLSLITVSKCYATIHVLAIPLFWRESIPALYPLLWREELGFPPSANILMSIA